ncbi:MAG: septum formation initiator family protein [Ruminococcaceae bacterium]|nr:septum formation initiator family protein [Oscillospiraceae bacterium]
MLTKKNRTKAIYNPLMILFVLACVFMIGKGLMQQPKIIENEEQIEELRRKIEYEKQRIEEVEEMKTKVDTDEYIEKVAREKLGMIKRDEILFIDITGQ